MSAMPPRPSLELVYTLREFCSVVYGAQCLVVNGEVGPRVSALMRYAGALLDAIDVQLLEMGLPPEASELASASRLRERFARLVLMLVASSLRVKGTRATVKKSRRVAVRSAA